MALQTTQLKLPKAIMLAKYHKLLEACDGVLIWLRSNPGGEGISGL